MHKKNKLAKGSLILAIGTFVAKAFGVLYRIPLTNMLGCYGLGLYQMIFPVYTVLLDFSGAGVPSALSRLISAFTSDQRKKMAGEYLRASVRLLVFLGLIGTLIMALASRGFAVAQGDAGATLGYIFLSPAVLAVCLISCLRGYFQGQMNMLPTAISQMVEQVIKLVFGLLFVYILLPDINKAVAGAAFAITVSEFSALVQLYVTYKIDKKKGITCCTCNITDNQNKQENTSDFQFKTLAKNIIKNTIPITLTGILIPIAHVIDSLIVVNIISSYRADATALYGIQSGVVCTVLNLPVALCYGISTTAIPTISSLKTDQEKNTTAKRAILLTAVFSAVFSLCLFFGAKLIIGLLFPRLTIQEKTVAVNLLRLTSPAVLLLSLLQTSNGILIGKGRLYLPVFTLASGIVIKTIISILTISVPKINIYGGGISLIACYFIVSLVNLILIFTLKAKDGSKKFTSGQYHH